jgi:phosphoribosylaminoimidazolecarboxamide formyltransferase/IMP cyclohydrolase
MAGIKRALISVSDKTGVVEMAKGLAAGGETFDRRNGKSLARGRGW